MSRELRKVPANWEHPKLSNGNYQPLYNCFYGDAIKEWLEEHQQWEDGTHRDLLENPELKKEYPFYAMYFGNPPDVEFYQTVRYSAEELTHIQLYETCSEGTPTTPVFPADQFEQLCEYAAKHATTFGYNKTTKENWMKMLQEGLVHHTEGNITFI